VYYEDTDAQGVVYFANYLKFMERGRTEWLRERGIEQDELRRVHGLLLTVTETSARFHKPARFNDEVVVLTRVLHRGRARFTLEQAVHRQDLVLCSADCIVACIDAENFRPRRIPDGILSPLDATASGQQSEESRR
jgi:acyl-CoA thioester hydrolase